jgi:hypothetical protein
MIYRPAEMNLKDKDLTHREPSMIPRHPTPPIQQNHLTRLDGSMT